MEYLLKAIFNPAFLGNIQGQQVPGTGWGLIYHYFFFQPNRPNKPPPDLSSGFLAADAFGGAVFVLPAFCSCSSCCFPSCAIGSCGLSCNALLKWILAIVP